MTRCGNAVSSLQSTGSTSPTTLTRGARSIGSETSPALGSRVRSAWMTYVQNPTGSLSALSSATRQRAAARPRMCASRRGASTSPSRRGHGSTSACAAGLRSARAARGARRAAAGPSLELRLDQRARSVADPRRRGRRDDKERTRSGPVISPRVVSPLGEAGSPRRRRRSSKQRTRRDRQKCKRGEPASLLGNHPWVPAVHY